MSSSAAIRPRTSARWAGVSVRRPVTEPRTPSAAPTSATTSSPEVTPTSSTKCTRGWVASRASTWAMRVLPMPPGPTIEVSRLRAHGGAQLGEVRLAPEQLVGVEAHAGRAPGRRPPAARGAAAAARVAGRRRAGRRGRSGRPRSAPGRPPSRRWPPRLRSSAEVTATSSHGQGVRPPQVAASASWSRPAAGEGQPEHAARPGAGRWRRPGAARPAARPTEVAITAAEVEAGGAGREVGRASASPASSAAVGLAGEPAQQQGVDLVGRHAEPVPPVVPLDGLGAEGGARAGDQDLERLGRVGGLLVAPDQPDQAAVGRRPRGGRRGPPAAPRPGRRGRPGHARSRRRGASGRWAPGQDRSDLVRAWLRRYGVPQTLFSTLVQHRSHQRSSGVTCRTRSRPSSPGARARRCSVETINVPDPGPGEAVVAGPGLRGVPHRPALPRGRHQRRLPLPARPRGGRRRRVGRRGRHRDRARRLRGPQLAGGVRRLPRVHRAASRGTASPPTTRPRR